jgi:hypothetical protein
VRDVRRLVLAVFIDGLGWEVLRGRRFLDDLLPHRSPMATMFGYSSTCDPTILTGRLPREHGHFSSFFYAPEASPFRPWRALGLLPASVADRGRVRRWISRAVCAAHGYDGYFQLYAIPFRHLHLFDYAEKRDIYRPGGILGGQPTVFDRLRAAGLPFSVSDWRRPEAENLEEARRRAGEGGIALAWVFLGGLDEVLHAEGTRSPAVDRHLATCEERLRAIVAAARDRYAEVRVHLFSDHGMTDVVDTSDLVARVERTGLGFGTDYVAMYDSTMARFWFLRPGARERVLEALSGERRGRVVTEAELAAWGCDFPGHRYGEVYFLLDPGVLLCPGFMGARPIPGMHGFDPADARSVAAYLTNAEDSPRPASLTDLHGLVLREAGVGEPQ